MWLDDIQEGRAFVSFIFGTDTKTSSLLVSQDRGCLCANEPPPGISILPHPDVDVLVCIIDDAIYAFRREAVPVHLYHLRCAIISHLICLGHWGINLQMCLEDIHSITLPDYRYEYSPDNTISCVRAEYIASRSNVQRAVCTLRPLISMYV